MYKNKIVFSSYCPEYLQERYGALKLKASFNFFHPEIPFILYGEKDINRVYKEYNVNLDNALPCLMLDIKKRFNAEYICHIDADSLVLGRLDHILNFDYEIASCLNNPDIGDRCERQNRPIQLHNLPNNLYVSCGCISTNSEHFLSQWHDSNQQIVKEFGGVKAFWMCDQNMMNILFHSQMYKSKILDPLDSNFFYGASANMSSNNNYFPKEITEAWGGLNPWQAWFDIRYKENKFSLYDKEVKILHNSCGGNKDKTVKCSFILFNEETRKQIQNITNINE